MKQIIGNQEQRTSRIDTEKWKEHAKYYNSPNSIKRDEGIHGLEHKLKYDSEGRPTLKLKEIAKTAVSIPTIEEHDMMMQIYEAGGWTWSGQKIPTNYSISIKYSLIVAESEFSRYSEEEYKQVGLNIMTTQRFCEIQNITSDMIKELSEWYDKSKPHRRSKQE